MLLVNIAVPVLSVLLGALITYRVNVRSRRRTYVEDLFNRAIAAVAVADASIEYTSTVRPPPDLPEDRFAELQYEFVIDGIRNWRAEVREATEALASVVPYQPEIAAEIPFQCSMSERRADVVIELLKRGRATALR